MAAQGLEQHDTDALCARLEGDGAAAHGTMRSLRGADLRPDLSTLVGLSLATGQGIRVACVVGDPRMKTVEERWLVSLLHHVGLSAANRLLREREVERRELHEQYLHRVLTAQEDERCRIARELHDTLAQDLAALRLELERLSNRSDVGGLGEPVKALEQRAHHILVMVRQILLDLRLTVLDRHALVPTLQAHLERVETQHGVRGVLTVHGEEPELRYEVAVTLFRIFQESLQNVVQHARAQHAFVTLSFHQHEVVLEIEDDGCGFDREKGRAQKPDRDGRGLGLLGIEERARLLHGRCDIDSGPDDGTTVRVSIPVEAA